MDDLPSDSEDSAELVRTVFANSVEKFEFDGSSSEEDEDDVTGCASERHCCGGSLTLERHSCIVCRKKVHSVCVIRVNIMTVSVERPLEEEDCCKVCQDLYNLTGGQSVDLASLAAKKLERKIEDEDDALAEQEEEVVEEGDEHDNDLYKRKCSRQYEISGNISKQVLHVLTIGTENASLKGVYTRAPWDRTDHSVVKSRAR
jgi:hypothetical protein